MPVTPVIEYTLGFVFIKNLTANGVDHVLLLKKKKPANQAGKYNGIGGRFEKKETKENCIVREAFEEANIITTPEQWTFIGILAKPKKWRVHVAYTYIDDEQLTRVPNECDEGELFLPRVNALPQETLPSVRWLIPLIQNHPKERQKDFVINYLPDDEE